MAFFRVGNSIWIADDRTMLFDSSIMLFRSAPSEPIKQFAAKTGDRIY